MKVYILPKGANTTLLKLLYSFRDYGTLIDRLQIYLRSSMLADIRKRDELILLINKIFLYNMFKYAETGSNVWFATSLKNNTIGVEMNVDPIIINEFFKPLMGMSISDVDTRQVENLIADEIYSYILNKYTEYSPSLNECFIHLFETLQTYIPYRQITLHRFEITQDLIPLVIYTDRYHQTYGNSLNA